jgi:hypothetical protein
VNPYFLYTLDCSETDFHVLRSEQHFLFDFQMFPSYIIQHLESCMSSSTQQQEQASQYGGKRFLCSLQLGISNEGVLSLVEQNQYQTLVHVSLKLKQGNDETIKKYLAGKLRETRDVLESKVKAMSSMEDTLVKAQTSNEQLMTDYNQLREDHRRLVDQMRLEEQKHMNELKERMLIEQAEVQSRAEAEKREMAQKHEREVRSLMEKVE